MNLAGTNECRVSCVVEDPRVLPKACLRLLYILQWVDVDYGG